MKILHITNWFPNNDNSKEALFIQRQINSLSKIESLDQKIIHLSITPGKLRFKKEKSFGANHIMVNIPTKRWILVEIVSFFLLSYQLLIHKANNYNIINFHIAYPNLTFWHLIKKWIRPRVLITEHWSAYHFCFGLSDPPPRIQNIFRQKLPVVTVSNALMTDIKKFSESEFPGYIIPNIVDNEIFILNDQVEREKNRFFMVAQWKDPKDPFTAIKAFDIFIKTNPESLFVIGGYGGLYDGMKQLIADYDLQGKVNLIGVMNPFEIALEMQKASAYIHSSGYETFSVVCAEALNCGCPVIASNVGGIPEFVNEENGILVDEQSEKAFSNAMLEVVSNEKLGRGLNGFSADSIAERYFHVLDEISQ